MNKIEENEVLEDARAETTEVVESTDAVGTEKPEKKPKKLKKKKQIAKLTEQNAKLEEQLEAAELKAQQIEKKCLGFENFMALSIAILFGIVALLILQPYGYPSGKELKDCFVEANSKYDHSETFFNLKGYLKENGFKHYEVSYSDYTSPYVYVTARNKYWEIRVETKIGHTRDDGNCYSTKVSLYKLDGISIDYTAVYYTECVFDPNVDEIVMDTGSSLMMPRAMLEEIDALLKAKNYDGSKQRLADRFYSDECPFQRLGIEHYVRVGSVTPDSPHDD